MNTSTKRKYFDAMFWAAFGVAGALLALQFLANSRLAPRDYIPPPTAILLEMVTELGRGETWVAVVETLKGWAVGLAISLLAAVPVGILLGMSPRLELAFRAPIDFLRPVPPVALVPAIVLIYGSTQPTQIVLIVITCFWPLLIQTMYGVRDVDRVARDMARAYQLGQATIMWRIVLPTAAPYLFTGLRTASTLALLVAIAAELIAGVPGIGREIAVAGSGTSMSTLYALIFITGFLGIAVNLVFVPFRSWALFWHPSERGEHT
jgi:ABC-type nitrate/sulfonate/bicarbonate transport system permease component